MHQRARVDGWPRLYKYDIICDWGQNWFTRSLSGGYKMTNGVVYASYSLRMEGQLEFSSAALPMCLFHRGSRECKLRVKYRYHGCEVKSSESTESCSRWARWRWRMVMANDSTNSMRSSAMSDVFVVFFTFLAHFWLVIILVHTTFVCVL